MSAVGTPDIEPTPEVSAIVNGAKKNNKAQPLAKKKKRLASDVIGQLEDKLEEDDLDIETWIELIKKIESKDKIEQVRETYDAFLKKFPFLANQWINYINYELNRGEFDKVENLFRRCLYNLSNIELWNLYVGYIRRKNNLITGGEEARRIIFQAYDLAISKVGIDPSSGPLWEEYLGFIEDWKPISKWDEQQKMDIKRKIFKKALVLPLNNIEKLWTSYTTFENELNTTTARKFIGEISGAYMTSRSCYKEWFNLTKDLIRNDNSIIPKSNEYDSKQLKIWFNWIKWESLNKLELNKEQLIERIDYVYKQAIQQMIFYPELWFNFVKFYKENEDFFSILKIEELLNESLLVNPTSFLLNFKLVEVYEIQNNIALIEKTFNKLIEILTLRHNKKSLVIEEIKSEVLEKALIERKKKNNEKAEDDLNDENGNRKERTLTDEEKEHVIKSNDLLQEKLKDLAQLSKIITITYVHYMKCIKRLKGLKDSRLIFSLCRKSKATLTHHIFVESAYLEYFNGEKSTALKVFNLGLKPNFFNNDGEYIFKYLRFLIKINDDTNLRSLFETTITNKKDIIEPKWLKKIYLVFLHYESNFGQLTNVIKLENKFLENFPNEDPIKVFSYRYNNNINSEFGEELFEEDTEDLIKLVDLSKAIKAKSKSKSNKRQKLESQSGAESDADEDDEFKKILQESKSNDDGPDNKAEETGFKKQFVSDEIYNLLRVLPTNSYFPSPIFNNAKLIELLKSIG